MQAGVRWDLCFLLALQVALTAPTVVAVEITPHAIQAHQLCGAGRQPGGPRGTVAFCVVSPLPRESASPSACGPRPPGGALPGRGSIRPVRGVIALEARKGERKGRQGGAFGEGLPPPPPREEPLPPRKPAALARAPKEDVAGPQVGAAARSGSAGGRGGKGSGGGRTPRKGWGGGYREGLSSQSLYSTAVAHEKKRDYNAARRIYAGLAEGADDGAAPDGRNFLQWGRMEARLGKLADARRVFARGLRALPQNTQLMHAWAVTEMRANHPDEARHLLKYALEQDPSDGLLYQSLALLEQQQGGLKAAREMLERGTDADPRNVYLWSARGVLESRLGRYSEALPLFAKATELDRWHVQSWQARGVALEKLGREEEAADMFENAIEADPSSVPTLQAYGLMQARRGNVDSARSLFAKGSELDAGHAPILHAWARMEEGVGNYTTARALFKRGVEAEPRSVALLKAWAKMEVSIAEVGEKKGWSVSQQMAPAKLEKVEQRLEVLRLMIEQRSEDDLKLVMTWLERQRLRKGRESLDKVLRIGEQTPGEWREGVEYSFAPGRQFAEGELVVLAARADSETGSRPQMFGRVGEKIGALELRVAFKEGKGLGSASGKPAGKGTILAGKGAVWDTVNIGEVGKILLSRKALADKLVGGAGDASSYRLHSLREADEELLGDLMSRYGEDFNANLWFPSRAQAILAWSKDELAEPGQASIFDGYPDGGEGGGGDNLQQWVSRRSDEDVHAFKEWFNDRYQRDPGTGIRVLEWELQEVDKGADKGENAPVKIPKEWSRIENLEKISPALENQEVTVYTAESKFRRLVEARMGLKEVRIRQVEGLLAAGVLAGMLMATPAFISTWVHRSEPSVSSRPAVPPNGVDAYLIQTDFSSDQFVLQGSLDDCDHVIPKFIKTCKKPGAKELPEKAVETLQGLLSQGLSDDETAANPSLKGFRITPDRVRQVRQEIKAQAARAQAHQKDREREEAPRREKASRREAAARLDQVARREEAARLREQFAGQDPRNPDPRNQDPQNLDPRNLDVRGATRAAADPQAQAPSSTPELGGAELGGGAEEGGVQGGGDVVPPPPPPPPPPGVGAWPGLPGFR